MKKWIKVTINELKNPIKSGLYNLITNSWWIVDNDLNAFFFESMSSPQCNRNKSIMERAVLSWSKELIELDQDCKIVFIEKAFVNVTLDDLL